MSLRGLGSQRTLVLINGRRVAGGRSEAQKDAWRSLDGRSRKDKEC